MIYTEMTRKAMNIAYNAHHGNEDKGGFPYIFHPIHLAEQMDTEETVCIALLHDVVEDTPVSFEYLTNEGFSEDILAALRLLTHEKSTDYFEYVQCIKDSGNQDAITVKLADLRHNSNMDRIIDKIEETKIDREKYQKAIKLLESI